MRCGVWGVVLAAALAPVAARAEEGLPRIHAGEGLAGIFSEVRLGGAWHDIGAKERGANVLGEVLFASPVPARLTTDMPPLYRWVFQPRVHLGFAANTEGYTSYGYAGLTWTTMLARDVFRRGDGIRFDFFFGGSLNNGKHVTNEPDRKSLGGNLLFRVGGEIGYQIDPRWSVSLFLDHESNAGSARANEGLNSLGLRIGFGL
ncbi:acyloxyacyl hydrolase [Siccirubricoccus phaeus]|uniref:acyloxyacyl hydrolase n=1 Tax=Siccirubricoccus phaeus TaxID=2595053 RepID=UPI0011F366F6|nr:acyloxyacyl hydrolase [Siccirubricoccus phaeus]